MKGDMRVERILLKKSGMESGRSNRERKSL
jgi:hypothetical protein